ncbi:hypothetical protein GGX14DRAFT_405836 [Mycena pura]|uniref:Uncharacterized protein n=1 Tax=Mycena pura TaxID=153505 RepID=A0AAD6Y253_9AGAR|nr:hypothetical protein GGX14DRAFT_405836 [Mycena pura]
MTQTANACGGSSEPPPALKRRIEVEAEKLVAPVVGHGYCDTTSVSSADSTYPSPCTAPASATTLSIGPAEPSWRASIRRDCSELLTRHCPERLALHLEEPLGLVGGMSHHAQQSREPEEARDSEQMALSDTMLPRPPGEHAQQTLARSMRRPARARQAAPLPLSDHMSAARPTLRIVASRVACTAPLARARCNRTALQRNHERLCRVGTETHHQGRNVSQLARRAWRSTSAEKCTEHLREVCPREAATRLRTAAAYPEPHPTSTIRTSRKVSISSRERRGAQAHWQVQSTPFAIPPSAQRSGDPAEGGILSYDVTCRQPQLYVPEILWHFFEENRILYVT